MTRRLGCKRRPETRSTVLLGRLRAQLRTASRTHRAPRLAFSGPALYRSPMHLDFSKLPPREAYEWLTNAILPRPIAWVSTLSAEGKTNLAPFSFFQGITANPPTLMFVPVNNRAGQPKDTLRNIEAIREFVVNVVPFGLAEPMNACAALLPHGESEFEAFAIAATPSTFVRPPRVALAPAAIECALHSFAATSAQASTRAQRRRVWAGLLARLAADLVPLHPGRHEPRAVKRRPKSYPHLSRPRRDHRIERHGARFRRPAKIT